MNEKECDCRSGALHSIWLPVTTGATTSLLIAHSGTHHEAAPMMLSAYLSRSGRDPAAYTMLTPRAINSSEGDNSDLNRNGTVATMQAIDP
jgi:hypothetical protein